MRDQQNEEKLFVSVFWHLHIWTDNHFLISLCVFKSVQADFLLKADSKTPVGQTAITIINCRRQYKSLPAAHSGICTKELDDSLVTFSFLLTRLKSTFTQFDPPKTLLFLQLFLVSGKKRATKKKMES